MTDSWEEKIAGDRERKRNVGETREMREKCDIGEPSYGTRSQNGLAKAAGESGGIVSTQGVENVSFCTL